MHGWEEHGWMGVLEMSKPHFWSIPQHQRVSSVFSWVLSKPVLPVPYLGELIEVRTLSPPMKRVASPGAIYI